MKFARRNFVSAMFALGAALTVAAPAFAQVAGSLFLSHISFGISISGDMTLPECSSTSCFVAVQKSASFSAR